jgi:hypothetical protein
VNDVLSRSQPPGAVEPPADQFAPSPAFERRVPLRRWGISLAVAVLLHVAIGAVVFLAWRQSVTLDTPRPVIVELAPPQSEPSAQSTEPTFATTGADIGRLGSTGDGDVDRPFAQFTPKSEVAEGATEPTFAAQSRGSIAPAERADENAADARTASGGGGMSAAPSAGLSGPIDTRIAPSFGSRAFDPRAKKPPRKLARSSSPLASQNKQAGGLGPARRLSALPPSSTVINAIGARVQDRVRAAIARANGSMNGARNAVGSNAAGNAGGASASAADSVVTNAIGIAVHVHPNIQQPMGSAIGTGATAPAGGRLQVTGINGANINGASFNGANMGRPTFRVGAIGGPVKNTVGVLSGTDFHPRHP